MPERTPEDDPFDEDFYLRAYPDVAEAVKNGSFASGRAHFLLHGKNEGRSGTPLAMLADVNPFHDAGRRYAREAEWRVVEGGPAGDSRPNPLRAFFENRKQGRGIWKWRHYFDIYERHFARFRNREVHVLEVGIYSGGSLEMWREYFGPEAHIYGVDIEPACKVYEGGPVRVFIGDQSDRAFWRQFRKEVPRLDIVIDDGGHLFYQQVATLEELLPHLQPGGVFLCEDVHGEFNPFATYAHGLSDVLNAYENMVADKEDPERCIVHRSIPFQSSVGSVAFYPFVIVIERNESPVPELVAPKHGTEWQPFLR